MARVRHTCSNVCCVVCVGVCVCISLSVIERGCTVVVLPAHVSQLLIVLHPPRHHVATEATASTHVTGETEYTRDG